MPEPEKQSDIASLTVELLSAYLSNNTVPSAELAGLIQSTRAALTQDAAPAAPEAEKPTFTPAVSARKSLASPEHIVSMIDGKPYKTLKRHLSANGLTPESYRERYNLPASYPMVAPSFAAKRREIAERIGLGNKKATDPAIPADAVAGANIGEESDVAAPIAAKPKKQAPRMSAVKAVNAPARKAKATPKPTATSAETVTAPVAEVAARPVEPQVAEQAVETPSAAPTATKNAAKAPARGAAPKKQPTKRMARSPKPAAKSEAAAPVSEESSPAETAAGETTDAPASAEKPKRRGKLGLFGKEAADTEAATGTPAPTAGAAKTRWKRPAAKAK